MENLFKPTLTGTKLKELIYSTPSEREPLAEGFLYRNSCIMISADPGLGKSTVSTCAMAQLSSGLPLFGKLFVPRPIKVFYIPFERGAQEVMERLKYMEQSIPLNYENIYINEEFIGLNVIDNRHADIIVETIARDCANPDLIILDPIYSAVAGGLSSDDKASQFTRFSSRLMKTFNCSIWMNHHTVKDSYTKDGDKVEKDDPFYGSQWLKAHVTAAYYMRKNPKEDGTILINKKDSHSNLLSKIPLSYNPDNYISYIEGLDIELPVRDRIMMFIRTTKKIKNTFKYAELKGCLTGVSNARVRHLIGHPPFSEGLIKHKSSGDATLYEIISDF